MVVEISRVEKYDALGVLEFVGRHANPGATRMGTLGNRYLVYPAALGVPSQSQSTVVSQHTTTGATLDSNVYLQNRPFIADFYLSKRGVHKLLDSQKLAVLVSFMFFICSDTLLQMPQ
jgi:hypothetical protein